ncbi:carbonic anhydrase [Cyclobacteriaceae bacterium]|nr:carbonic anhydrase [Cyclobacteriaceae bacterium]
MATTLNASEALERLKAGNEKFVKDSLSHDRQDVTRRESYSGGVQEPYAIILSCADSRVVPELVFDEGIGDVFVIRVAGNIANASSIASIEYAVANLGVKLIVVLGHENCGAVKATVANHPKSDISPALDHLVDHIMPVVNSKEDDVNTCVKLNAKKAVKDLTEKSTIISEADGLEIVSGYYNLASGKVDFL